MKKIFGFLLSLLLLFSTQGQTVSELQRILASIGNTQSVTGQATATVGNNALLATAGTGSVDLASFATQQRTIFVQFVTPAASTADVLFESSQDGTTWNPVVYQEVNISSSVQSVAPISLAASTNRYFMVKPLFRLVRARITAATGTGTQAFVTYSPYDDNFPTTNTLEPATFIAGAAAQTAIVNNIIPEVSGAAATEVVNFRSMSVQVISTGTGGTFIFEQSNDGVNFRPLPVFNAEVVTGASITAAITATASQIVYTFPIRCRFVRLRIASTITGGSIRAFSRISTEPWTAAAQLVGSPTAANFQTTANQGGTWTVQPGNTANLTPWLVEQRTGTTNGSTTTAVNSAATTNGANLKATGGMIYAITAMNTNAATRFVRLYNLATAPTVGTSTPVMVIAIPPTSSKEITFPNGLRFATGIGYAITGAAPVLDATAVAAGDVQLLINWQ